jgi:hypothetical protein
MLRLMRMRKPGMSLVLTALLPLAACGEATRASSSAPEDARARAAVRTGDDGSRDQALASGVLRADPTTGCLWLEQPTALTAPNYC